MFSSVLVGDRRGDRGTGPAMSPRNPTHKDLSDAGLRAASGGRQDRSLSWIVQADDVADTGE